MLPAVQGLQSMDMHSLHAGIHVLCRSGAPAEAQLLINGMWARGMDPGTQVPPPPLPPVSQPGLWTQCWYADT